MMRDFFTLIAIAILALYAFQRFNRPSWARSYATFKRFNYARVVYIIIHVLVFLVVLTVVRPLLFGPGHALLSLLITLAIMSTELGDWLRSVLHKSARVPRQAHKFASHLLDAALVPSATVKREVEAMMRSRSIPSEAETFEIAWPLLRQFERASHLFVQIRDWEKNPKFRRFLRETDVEFDTLRQQYDTLSLRVSRVLRSVERIGEIKNFSDQRAPDLHDDDHLEADIDDRLRRLSGDLIADICDDVRNFYRLACTFTARGILASSLSRKQRDTTVMALGFQGYENMEIRDEVQVLLLAGLLLYLGIWIFFLLAPTPTTAMRPRTLVFIITLNVAISVSLGLAKVRWGFANSGWHQKTPYRFLLSAGLLAVVLGSLINALAGFVVIGGVNGAIERWIEGSIYLPNLFMTTAAIGWLVQDERWGRASAIRARLYDAATISGVWAGCAFVARELLAPLVYTDAMLRNIHGHTAFAVVGGLVLGGILGLLVPSLFRARRDTFSPYKTSAFFVHTSGPALAAAGGSTKG
jgi:hypothetical protein